MSSAPRFENQQIVNSFNLFLDSERAVIQGDSQSRGDDMHIQFEGNSVEAGDGEVIKLTLKEFSMANTLYTIDFNNSRGIVKGVSSHAPATYPASSPVWGLASTYDLIDRANYEDVYTIASVFSIKMRRILNLLVDTTSKAFEATILGPIFQVDFVPGAPSAAGTSPPYIPEAKRPQFGQTDNRLLYIQFTCKSISTGTIEAPAGSPTAHGITNLKVQLAASEGDTYTILGGERMDGTANNNIFSSLIIDFTTDPNVVSMKGYFPMTRYSEPSMYIRTNCQNGLETSVLQSGAIAGGNALIADVITSDILGKINRYTPAGNSEFITYNSQSDEFFITLQQRKLTNLRIFLTDSKGRKLGRPTPDNDNSGTAAGLENTLTIALLDGGTPSMVSKRQSELGNLFFTAVIRIDVVKTSCPNQLQSEVFSPPYPGSKSGGILPFTSFAERPILRK